MSPVSPSSIDSFPLIRSKRIPQSRLAHSFVRSFIHSLASSASQTNLTVGGSIMRIAEYRGELYHDEGDLRMWLWRRLMVTMISSNSSSSSSRSSKSVIARGGGCAHGMNLRMGRGGGRRRARDKRCVHSDG